MTINELTAENKTLREKLNIAIKALEEYVRDDCGQFYLATFKTKNGYHVVAKREFNGTSVISELADYAFENGLTKEFLDSQNRPLVELKENAMVLVAMGE